MKKSKKVKCEDCGKTLTIGSWPYCPHPGGRPANAFFAPIVVYRGPNGEISIPASSDAPPPKGFNREEITTRKQANSLTKQMDAEARDQFRSRQRTEQEFYEKSFATNREEIRKLYEGIDDPRVREFMDIAMREGDRSDREAWQYNPGTYFQELE